MRVLLGFYVVQKYMNYERLRWSMIKDLGDVKCLKHIGISINFDSYCVAAQCPEGTVKCPNSYCIPLGYIEDGVNDCPNGEDEFIDYYQYTSFQKVPIQKMCYTFLVSGNTFQENSKHFAENPFLYILRDTKNFYCSFGEDKLMSRRNINYNFQCRRNNDAKFRETGLILHPSQLCDGVMDCFYGDDEQDCHYSCPPGLRCEANTVTVSDISQVGVITKIPNAKLVDLSGVRLNVGDDFVYSLQYTIDMKLQNCNISSSNLSVYYGDSVEFLQFKTFDLSQNNLEYLDESLAWILCASKLNLSGNTLLRLTFSERDVLFDRHNLLKAFDKICFQTFERSTKIQYKNIHILDLSYTKVDNDQLKQLSRFVNLQEIYLRNCPISSLEPGLPTTLRVIDLRGISLKLPQEKYFSDFTDVSELLVESFLMCCPQVLGETITPDKCTHTIIEAISSCENLITNPILNALLWMMGICALLANVIVIIYRYVIDVSTFKTTYGIFIFNLSIADLLMGVYLMVLAVVGKRFQGDYYKHHPEWRKGLLCQADGFLSMVSSEVSALFVLFITFDRFLAVRFPLGQVRLTKKMSVYLCVGAWIAGLILSLIPLLMPDWEVYSISSICVGLPLTTDDYSGKSYSVFIFVSLNFVLFLLIAIGQYLILKAKSNYNSKSQNLFQSGQNAQKRYENDLAIARQLSLVVITDFCCWFPIGVMGLMALYGIEISKDAYVLAAIFIVPINSAINPLLYTVPTLKKKWTEVISRFRSSVQPRHRPVVRS